MNFLLGKGTLPPGIRIVCISDTHNKLPKILNDIPNGDILIHAGDFSLTGIKQDIAAYRNAIESLPHAHKVLIAGNHDITLNTDYYKKNGRRFHSGLESEEARSQYSIECKTIMTDHNKQNGYYYLEDEGCTIDFVNSAAQLERNNHCSVSVNIYGSPWQPEFCDWAWNLPLGNELKEKWDMIPAFTDILITHGPPKGILDKSYNGTECGCDNLLDCVKNRVKPRLHIFGHIHESYGYYFDDTTLFVNASTCNLSYKPINPPVVIHLPFDRNLPAIIIQ